MNNTIDAVSTIVDHSLPIGSLQDGTSSQIVGVDGDSQGSTFIDVVMEPLMTAERYANETVSRFDLSGSTLDYTEAVLAVSKIRSDIELYATLRDKLIQSYQQFLNMQI